MFVVVRVVVWPWRGVVLVRWLMRRLMGRSRTRCGRIVLRRGMRRLSVWLRRALRHGAILRRAWSFSVRLLRLRPHSLRLNRLRSRGGCAGLRPVGGMIVGLRRRLVMRLYGPHRLRRTVCARSAGTRRRRRVGARLLLAGPGMLWAALGRLLSALRRFWTALRLLRAGGLWMLLRLGDTRRRTDAMIGGQRLGYGG